MTPIDQRIIEAFKDDRISVHISGNPNPSARDTLLYIAKDFLFVLAASPNYPLYMAYVLGSNQDEIK